MTPAEFRAWCERRGYTQEQAAGRLGTTQETVSRWQSGVHRVRPSIERLIHLLDQTDPAQTPE